MNTDIESQQLRIERRKLAIERLRIRVERDKLRIEKNKAVWTAIAMAVPILITAATIGFGFYSLQQTAKSEFQRKAAELALNAEGPNEVAHRAAILAALFGDQLPANFKNRMKTAATQSYAESKEDLLKLLAENPRQRNQILNDWRIMFVGDARLTNQLALSHDSGAPNRGKQ